MGDLEDTALVQITYNQAGKRQCINDGSTLAFVRNLF